MIQIVLVMRRMVFAQSLTRILAEKNEFHVRIARNYQEAEILIEGTRADAAMIEVSENDEGDMRSCLSLCSEIRSRAPNCRLLLMCSENMEEAVREVIRAKLAREIDDFVFYDTSLRYLISKIESLA